MLQHVAKEGGDQVGNVVSAVVTDRCSGKGYLEYSIFGVIIIVQDSDVNNLS